MPTLPAGIATVTVTGTLLHADGSLAVGSVRFVPSVSVLYVGPNAVTLPSRIDSQLVAGLLTVVLPATDDIAGNPVGWTYKVEERVRGGRSFSMALPAAPATQDYTDLVPVPSNGGTAVGAVAITGVPTTGQVPTATGSTSATWQTPTGGIGGTATTDASLLTTGTLADARLPAGSNAATVAAKLAIATAAATYAPIASPAAAVSAHVVAVDPHGDRANTTAQITALGLGAAATKAVGTTAGTVAAGDDPRFVGGGTTTTDASLLTSGTLDDARLGVGSQAATVAGKLAATDPSVTNARTPTAHAVSHTAGGSDAVTVTEAQVTGLTADLAAKAPLASPTFTGVVSGVTKAHVGLSNVDNTTDLGKPVSTAQAAADGLRLLATDPSVTNARTPTAHAASHASAGSDPVTVAESQVTNLVVDLAAKADLTTAQTLTNKRITSRVGTVASSATPTPDANAHDLFTVTALAVAATFAAPTGTPTDGQRLVLRIKDNATARALSWNAVYRVVGAVLPSTTVISKTAYVGCVWNAAAAVWDVLAVGVQA